MSISFFTNKYLILVLSFFTPMIINIGGEVSPSFLFILITLPFWIKYLDFRKDKILKFYKKFFFTILLVQILWLPFAQTDLFIQIKGILITLSGLLFFLYYYLVYIHNSEVIKWSVLGTFLSSFVFINVLAEIAGGEFGMWKFQIYPRIVSGTVLIYLWFSSAKWIQRFSPIILVSVGLLGLATGARSAGLPPLMGGVVTLFIQMNKNIRLSSIKKNLLLGAVLLYSLYALVYVPKVLDGSITGGNSYQLKQIENPYNPLNLIMMGRTDSVIPFIAFTEKPITGWGYFTPDPNRKYRKLMNQLTSQDINPGGTIMSVIPGHSVWGYYSCSYGIIVFIAFFLFIKKLWSILYYSFLCNDKYLLYRIYCAIGVTWNLLFSPISHFKWLPSTVALIIALSIITIRNQRVKKC